MYLMRRDVVKNQNMKYIVTEARNYQGFYLLSKTQERSQKTFTCPKSAKETLRKGVKYVKFGHILEIFLEFLLLTLNR